MEKILLDFRQMQEPRQMQEYMEKRFQFPEYYGGNLDALYDMLTDITEETCVEIIGISHPYYDKIRRVFCDAEENNPYLSVAFRE